MILKMDSDARSISDQSLIRVVQCVRPDIPLPDHQRMNIGDIRIAPSHVGSVATVPLTTSGFMNEGRIVIVGNSIAKLIVSCFRGRFQLESSRLIYIISVAVPALTITPKRP